MTMLNVKSMRKTVLASALLLSQSFYMTPLMVLADDGSVRLAGQVIFVNKAGSGGMSASQRGDSIQNNLDNALVAAKDRTPSSVAITYVKGMPVITLGGYQVVTVDAANAKAAGTTPAVLAKRWADALRNNLRDQASVEAYVAQLSGNYNSSAPQVAQAPPAPSAVPASYGAPSYGAPTNQGYVAQNNGTYAQTPPPQQYNGGAGYGDQMGQPMGGYGAPQMGYPPMRQGHVAYAPQGLVIPVTLQTSISSMLAKPGDLIQANITQNVVLGDAQIPAGSVVTGTVTDSEAGRRLGRSGELQIKFNTLRTPDGVQTPISAHLNGKINKLTEVGGDQSDTFKGETWKNKVGQGVLRGAIGAGGGAALGTAIGAIAGRSGRATGRGAWSGAAIGGGLGLADSLILRKGKDVNIPSGTQMQLQLDAPTSVAGASPAQGGPTY